MQHYTFPEIRYISDVLPYIKGRKEFIVFEKDWYTVINYVVAFDTTFSSDTEGVVVGHSAAIRRECRGLIFDSASGKLISRGYHKFFNVNEREETALNSIDLSKPHMILDKLDGSMIRPISTPDGGYRLATKSGITDISMDAETFISDKPQYDYLIRWYLRLKYTPIFEFVYQQASSKRNVVLYEKTNLILTAIRRLYSGTYADFSYEYNPTLFATVPTVLGIEFSKNSLQDISEEVRSWLGADAEGVVVRFSDGHMCKVKAEDYVLKHRAIHNVKSEKNVLALILNDSVDDVLPLLHDVDKERLLTYQKKFWQGFSHTVEHSVASVVSIRASHDNYSGADMSRKDFAGVVECICADAKWKKPLLYGIFSGSDPNEILRKQLLSALRSQATIDSVRHLFGGIQWNQD